MASNNGNNHVRDYPVELRGIIDPRLQRRLDQLFEMVYQLMQSQQQAPVQVAQAVRQQLLAVGLIGAQGQPLIGISSTDPLLSQFAAAPGTGTVVSIDGVGGTNISVTGGPITSSGTLTVSISLTPAFTSVTVNGAKWSSGNGTPEGVVFGSVGDLFSRKDGGAATTLYVKESGAVTNTGWIAK